MWEIKYTKRFLKELSNLPVTIQIKAEKICFKKLLRDNPFELGYLEKMSGYHGKYKIRLGKYRIGVTADKQNRVLICQRIAHRKDIYRIFP